MGGYEEIGDEGKCGGCKGFEFFGGPEGKPGAIPMKLRKISVCLIIGWLVFCPMFAIFAPKLQGETSLAFDPPSGHPSDHAKKAMNRYWAPQEASSIIIMVITSRSSTGEFALTNTTAVREFVADAHHTINQTIIPGERFSGLEVTLTDYFVLNATRNPIASSYISPDGQAQIFQLTLKNPGSTADGSPYVHMIDFLRDDIVKDIAAKHADFNNNYDCAITGQQVLTIDARKGTIKDASHADLIVIPIAFFILACFLRSWRLMVIPLVTIGICIGAAFTAAYPIALAMKVQSTTPQLMMSAMLALNIDYNLFLLMRFRENYDLGFGLYENLHLMITHTAMETVLGSGSLVSVAFFSMAIIPCEALISTGICCGITIALVVAVNITLTPSILAIFGTFFAVPAEIPQFIKDRYCSKKDDYKKIAKSPANDEDENGSDHEVVEQENDEEIEAEKDKQAKSFFFRMGKLIQRAPIVVIVVVLALFSFLYVRFGDLQTSLDPFSYVPRNAQSALTWRKMAKYFPPGQFEQYYLVMEDVDGKGIQVEDASELVVDVLHNTPLDDNSGRDPRKALMGTTVYGFRYPSPVEIFDDLGMPFVENAFKCCPTKSQCSCDSNGATMVVPDSFTGFNFNCITADKKWNSTCPQQVIDYMPETVWKGILLNVEIANKKHNLSTISPTGQTIAFVVEGQTHMVKDDVIRAAYYRVFTPFEPTGRAASKWMDAMFPVMKNFTAAHPNINVYLAGGNTIPYDFNKIVDDYMYKMLGALLGAVVVIVSIVFRSASIPLIMAITIGYSTASSFGLAYYFFQTTAFSWFYSYLNGDFKDEGVSWSVPPMAISITVALAIDYDIFMLTRIAEYRKKYTSSAAILKGLYSVGSTICGAGIIMSVAFGGLMFSHVVSLNQFSVILVASVLLDTFLLSTIFVPACAFLMGDKFWWPAKSSAGVYDEWHFEKAEVEEETVEKKDFYVLQNQ